MIGTLVLIRRKFGEVLQKRKDRKKKRITCYSNKILIPIYVKYILVTDHDNFFYLILCFYCIKYFEKG